MSLPKDYRKVVPKETIDFLKCLAEQVKGKKILHINQQPFKDGDNTTLFSERNFKEHICAFARKIE